MKSVPKTTTFIWLWQRAVRKKNAAIRRLRKALRLSRIAGKEAAKRLLRARKLREGYLGLFPIAWLLGAIRRTK
jgi:hypothetical protein